MFAEAASDDEAAQIVDHLASEVVAMARAALTRLGLIGRPAEVLLGGGLLRSRDARLMGAIEAGLREVSPLISAHATLSPAIVGAALLGLDELGAAAAAQERLRRELGAAVEGGNG